MAAGDGAVYNSFKRDVLSQVIDLDADTLKACLVEGYTPDIDDDKVYSDVSGYEVSGTGYTAGGETLTGAIIIPDIANDKAYFDAEDATWVGLNTGDVVSHIVVYSDTPASKPLVAYWEVDVLAVGNDLTAQWGSGGILAFL